MAKKPPRPWIVTPHAPLRQIDDNLWEIVSPVPGFPPGSSFDRRMSIVRLSDGRLLFHNAVPVDDATLEQIRALGRPALLIAPHHLHAIDAHAFRDKLGVRVYSAAVSLDKTREIVAVDGTYEELPRDPAISVMLYQGSRFGEAGLLVHSGERTSLVVCDIVVHVPHAGGFVGALFRLFGFTGPDLKLPVPVRLRAFPKKALVKADLERLAAIPNLKRVIPSHGPIVEENPAAALRAVANGL